MDSGGTVIDSLSVFVPQRDLAAVLPRANLPARQMRFMGTVSPGMEKRRYCACSRASCRRRKQQATH